MYTRSGKRITPKLKKINYVSYPSTDHSEDSAKGEAEPPRKLRKHALQGLLSCQAESQPEQAKGKKNKNKKKIRVNPQVNPDGKENEIVEPIPKKAGKKKKNKKKDSSEIKMLSPNDKISSINNSATSIYSFHSAAGCSLKPSQPEKLNETFEKPGSRKCSRCNSDIADDVDKIMLNSNRSFIKNDSIAAFKDSTFDNTLSKATLETTFDKDSETKLNSTFDKNATNEIVNVTFVKSDESISGISFTSVDSKVSSENILNDTPVLVESSMETSHTPGTIETATRKSASLAPITPMKREGTFTIDSPEVANSPNSEKTPLKRQMSMASPGCTPYTSNSKTSNIRNKTLNLAHSLEKPGRKSPISELRTTRVMFCSPVNTIMMDTQRKSKVIKSSMKGSNKIFVFQNSEGPSSGRKRSLAQSEEAAGAPAGAGAGGSPGAKRKRLADELRQSVDRLSRPRTASVSKPVASATKSDSKRAKLPNFAALHRKQFARMESLGEFQQRSARRARQLLAPAGRLAKLERGSHKGNPTEPPKPATKDINVETTTKPEILNPGFTRFGFKLNRDVNPFSIPSKVPSVEVKEAKPVEKRPNGLKRQPTISSRVGAMSVRKEVAKQVLLQEKSSAALKERREVKREETRTIIKGVRTNRRFELQMRSRNI